MRSSGTVIATAFLAAVSVLGLSANEASALSAQECSAKYKSAKEAGTLAGKTWNDFRKAECGDGATADAPKADAAKKAGTTMTKTAAVAATFPAVIDPKFAKEKPARARLHTCAAQYKSNKTANANGGLKWIQKGGGYWSECNKHLKGKA